MFRSLLFDHLKGVVFRTSWCYYFSACLRQVVYLVCGCILSMCVSAWCTCLWEVRLWTVWWFDGLFSCSQFVIWPFYGPYKSSSLPQTLVHFKTVPLSKLCVANGILRCQFLITVHSFSVDSQCRGNYGLIYVDMQVSCGMREGGVSVTASIFRITLTHLHGCTYNFDLSFSVISLRVRYGLNASISYT
jgi:hypothetical protein